MAIITSFRIVIIVTITPLGRQHPVFSLRAIKPLKLEGRGIELHEECMVIKYLFYTLRIACATAFRFFLYHMIFSFMLLPKRSPFQ